MTWMVFMYDSSGKIEPVSYGDSEVEVRLWLKDHFDPDYHIGILYD